MLKEKPTSPIEEIDKALNKILKDAQRSIQEVWQERLNAKDAILARWKAEDVARGASAKPFD